MNHAQLVPNISATSLHESRRAQRAMNSLKALQVRCLPSAQGRSSTVTPHLGQSIRLVKYQSSTTKPHNGTNWNERGARAVSYVGPRRMHFEQIPCDPFRARMFT